MNSIRNNLRIKLWCHKCRPSYKYNIEYCSNPKISPPPPHLCFIVTSSSILLITMSPSHLSHLHLPYPPKSCPLMPPRPLAHSVSPVRGWLHARLPPGCTVRSLQNMGVAPQFFSTSESRTLFKILDPPLV